MGALAFKLGDRQKFDCVELECALCELTGSVYLEKAFSEGRRARDGEAGIFHIPPDI